MAPIDLVKVHFVNASGEGCSGEVAVPRGSTVQDLCVSKVPGFREDRYSVRVRRGLVAYGKKKTPLNMSMALEEGDQVQVSPSKPAMA